MTKPNTTEAREAVNVFASIDVLGLLDDPDYPGASTIEQAIKDHYNSILSGSHADLMRFAMTQPLQAWSDAKQQYLFSGVWDQVVSLAGRNHKKFANTQGTRELLAKYVRLIANRGDTQGWKLSVDGSDLTGTPPNQYLTEGYNLSIKAKPGQWIRWWGNSITPFSALQCVIGDITQAGRPHPLPQLEHQQDVTVVYNFPSGVIGEHAREYTTATNAAFSRMGELKVDANVGDRIPYDILFNLVDGQGDIVASFQVDPEIIVVN